MVNRSYISFKDTTEKEDDILKGFRRLQHRNPKIIKRDFLRFAKDLIELKGEYEADYNIFQHSLKVAHSQIQKLWSRIKRLFHG